MAYVSGNPMTKRELFERMARAEERGRKLSAFQPGGLFPLRTGRVSLEGPHFPRPHRWYAQATVDADGDIVDVQGYEAWKRAEARKASGEPPPARKPRADATLYRQWIMTQCSAKRQESDFGTSGHYIGNRYNWGGGYSRRMRCERCGDTLGAFIDRKVVAR